MHVRTQLRHRIVDLLLDMPNAKVHRNAHVRIDEGMLHDPASNTYTNHVVVTSFNSQALGDARKVIGGCCLTPTSFALEVAIFVASTYEGYEEKLDEIEASAWPLLEQFQIANDDQKRDWPELSFTQEVTQPSSPEATFPAFVRSLQFNCELDFDKVSPHQMNRLS